MQHLIATLDALIDATVEAIVAGFEGASDAQIAMRAKGAELRQRVAVVELLGPALSKLAHQLIDEAGRRAVPRYATILRSVRYNDDAGINELEDARRAMNVAVLAADKKPDGLRRSNIMLAIIRVRAITAVLGADCVAEPLDESSSQGSPLPRRREIGPGDISPVVARIVVAMARDRSEWDSGLARLAALETDEANVVGLVSSLIALAEQPKGHSYIRSIAKRIERAGLDLAEDQTPALEELAPEEFKIGGSLAEPMSVHAQSVAPAVIPTPTSAGPLAPPPVTQGMASDRAEKMRQFNHHLKRVPDAKALLTARHARANAGKPKS